MKGLIVQVFHNDVEFIVPDCLGSSWMESSVLSSAGLLWASVGSTSEAPSSMSTMSFLVASLADLSELDGFPMFVLVSLDLLRAAASPNTV